MSRIKMSIVGMQSRSFGCITRLCHPLPVSAETDVKKHCISKEFINRNPRNLEMMGIAHKRLGWQFQAPRKDYYHKLVLDRHGKHTTASLIHSSGRVVVSASTRESIIAKHLRSTADVNACFNIGRVMAHRCHQVGIDSMIFDFDACGDAVDKFKEAMVDGGISLEEVEAKPYPEDDVGTDYDNVVKKPIDYDRVV